MVFNIREPLLDDSITELQKTNIQVVKVLEAVCYLLTIHISSIVTIVCSLHPLLCLLLKYRIITKHSLPFSVNLR